MTVYTCATANNFVQRAHIHNMESEQFNPYAMRAILSFLDVVIGAGVWWLSGKISGRISKFIFLVLVGACVFLALLNIFLIIFT